MKAGRGGKEGGGDRKEVKTGERDEPRGGWKTGTSGASSSRGPEPVS